ncbi:class I SAM-dependent DNA methyltransferase [Natronolimnobius sp. AArcel1]|uniref:Eco57I restriction-modification methylase domain-containing protein n=1 Tax=Natronolimnobius sp. AArcel1 TaxID=1679093 RepID=UPI0013E9B76A|nr:TaqI-like C-terminal specificity domain-containing protein [Natronolimnobius sp. AArcel1]NGM71066.1 class I SAM-dependent DNA methyltransferase [Natronolimnobius sp. AArcel1]
MQTSHDFRTNRELFSNHYLEAHLPETTAWNAVSDATLEAAYEGLNALWGDANETAPKRNEAQLEERFIRPVFRHLGIPFEVEESTERTQRRPDYGFFESEASAREAFERREDGGDFYANAVAIADAKRWDRPLDTRGSGEHTRDFENPSYQIHVYLQETPAEWAVLTNGRTWRLYYAPMSHRLDSYYEIDLPELLETGDLEAFKYFYLFFRHEALLADGERCFLDAVYHESTVFAAELGADVQENVYEAITVLAEGFLQYPENDLEASDLERIHDSSLIYLYRLIFVLYAESEGRELLPTDNEIYRQSYSLNALKQEVATELDGPQQAYHAWQDTLHARLEELFQLIDQGSEACGIPPETLAVPAYNGGLFRTDPDENDSPEAQFLATHTVGDHALARVIELLARREADDGSKRFVDYSSLEVRHLGSIYEGLLEYRLNVADEPVALEGGEYVPVDADADASDETVVTEGEVYLTTDSGERAATGSYYTPEYIVEYIVEETLGPLVAEIQADLEDDASDEYADRFAERIFELRILDPAMGSGHFLTSAVDYLARAIIDAQETQAAQHGLETVDPARDINWARRRVAQRCLYGVDHNPLAVELAKVSLWLRTLAAEQPLAFLDHHLKTGNSLIGSDIEDVLDGDTDATEGGQLTLEQSFEHTRTRALEHVMDRFQELLAIDNETLADAKAMEDAYGEVQADPLYQHLLAMANVHTAAAFGLAVPDDAQRRMAEALRDDSWETIERQEWFRAAQQLASEERVFHWELEFPVAFYDTDGTRRADAGFDAVIGNPPYINIVRVPDDHVDYLKAEYETAFRRFDLYVLFSELAYEISAADAYHAYIVPDKLLTESYATNWRRLTLEEHGLETLLDVREANVFDDATNAPIAFVVRCGGSSESVVIDERVGTDSEPVFAPRTELPTSGFLETPDAQIRLDWTDHTQALLETIRADTIPLSRVAYASWGAQPGNASRFVFDERPDDLDQAEIKPLLKGSDLERFAVSDRERFLWYEPDELHRPAFPELFESEKLCFRKVAGQRGLVGTFDAEGFYTEDSVINVIRKADLLETDEDTLRARGIDVVDESRPTSDDGDDDGTAQTHTYDRDTIIYTDDLERSRDLSLQALLGIANSKLLHYYYATAISGQLNVFPEHVRSLPIDMGAATDDEIASAAARISELQTQRDALNGDVLAYLPSEPDGPALPDIGLYQPADSSILEATADEYDGLRIGTVRAKRDGETVTITATARYKPDDEDDHETDRWGYTETGFHDAFSLAALDETEATLVAAFVPAAAARAGGFAGFRETATKTNSLLDRLTAMVIPEPDSVAADLERYSETTARIADLEAERERLEDQIDRHVYEHYGLSETEIERVESAIRDE